jgi:ribonuclease P protein subunit RPR2
MLLSFSLLGYWSSYLNLTEGARGVVRMLASQPSIIYNPSDRESMARRYVGKRDAKDIARDRIDRLFALAEKEAATGNQGRAKRYVTLALRVGERHKVRAGHKRTYCPSCHAFYVPPWNLRVRTHRGRVSMTCLGCGHITRYPVNKKRM